MSTEVVKNYVSTVADEYNTYLTKIDFESISKAAALINASKVQKGRVHVTGIGKPSHIAGYAAALFSSTGTKAYILDATEAVHGSAGQVEAGDVVIAISNSGQTSELRQAITSLKNIGAKIIGVSGGVDSWLHQASDVFLYAGVSKEGDSMNKPPRLSILAETTILQCLSIQLQEDSHITMEDYYAWHPGGALGASIKAEMEDR